MPFPVFYFIVYQVIFIWWKFSDGWRICENSNAKLNSAIRIFCKHCLFPKFLLPNISSVSVGSWRKLPDIWHLHVTVIDCATTTFYIVYPDSTGSKVPLAIVEEGQMDAWPFGISAFSIVILFINHAEWFYPKVLNSP